MLVAIVGATGTGKSELSLALAERLAAEGERAEMVNADAMQLYQGMKIGTAKLSEGERRGIPHHMLDVLQVTEEASVAKYQADARAVIEQIEGRGAIPVLVGGSGLYVSSVLFNFEFPGTDPEVRAKLEQELVDRGPGDLYRRLKLVDPAAAESIGPSNGRRLVRALEVIEITGGAFGSGLPDDSTYWKYPTVIIGLRAPREELVPRLDERVLGMWRQGLVDEAKALVPAGIERGVTASKAIGYAQALGQIKGELTEARAIEQTAALTRKYARRQVGWFKRFPNTTWVDYDDPRRVDKALEAIRQN